MTDSKPMFLEFVSTCANLLKKDHPELLDLIRKRYNNCHESFRNSSAMVDLLNNTSTKLLGDQKRMFVHLRDFVIELKAWSSGSSKSQCSRKRRAPDCVGSVSKMLKIDDSVSEGSDMENKLCRAAASAMSDDASSSSSSHTHSTSVVQKTVPTLTDSSRTDTSQAALAQTNTSPEVCSIGSSDVPKVSSYHDSSSNVEQTSVSIVEVNQCPVNGPTSGGCIKVPQDKTHGLSIVAKTSSVHVNASSSENGRSGALSNSDSTKGKRLCLTIDRLKTSLPPCGSVSQVITKMNGTSSGAVEDPKVLQNGVCTLKAGSSNCIDLTQSQESSNGSTGSPQPGCSARDMAREAACAHRRPVDGGEKTSKKDKHIQRLEKLLEKVRDEIEKVREKELSLDDLNEEDSSYIYEDRLQKKFVKVWNRLCQLKGRNSTSGRPIERKFKYDGTRYPEINRKVEKFVNRPNVFPDYHDVRGIVKKVNTRCNLGLSVKQINNISRETFLDIGESLQRRRHEDFICTFRSRQTALFSTVEDPALMDFELQRKLEENQRIGRSRLEEVMNKYTELQMTLGETEQSDADESAPTGQATKQADEGYAKVRSEGVKAAEAEEGMDEDEDRSEVEDDTAGAEDEDRSEVEDDTAGAEDEDRSEVEDNTAGAEDEDRSVDDPDDGVEAGIEDVGDMEEEAAVGRYMIEMDVAEECQFTVECEEDDAQHTGQTAATSPAALEVSTPAVLEGSMPAVLEGSMPAALEVSTPAVLEGSMPAVLEGSMPAVLEGSMPAVLEGSMPAALEVSTPAVLEGSMPAVLEGSMPAVLEGSMPAVLEGSTPAVLEGSTPAVHEVSTTVEGDSQPYQPLEEDSQPHQALQADPQPYQPLQADCQQLQMNSIPVEVHSAEDEVKVVDWQCAEVQDCAGEDADMENSDTVSHGVDDPEQAASEEKNSNSVDSEYQCPDRQTPPPQTVAQDGKGQAASVKGLPEVGAASRPKKRSPVKISASLNLPDFLVRRQCDPSLVKEERLFYPDKMQSFAGSSHREDSITIGSSDEEGDSGEKEKPPSRLKTRRSMSSGYGEVIVLSDSE